MSKKARDVSLIIVIAIAFWAVAMMVSKIFLAPAHAVTAQGGDCRDLRRACELKDELGESDEEACIPYQKLCGGSNTPHVNCVWLRTGCMWGEELGTNARATCQRYRQNCKAQ